MTRDNRLIGSSSLPAKAPIALLCFLVLKLGLDTPYHEDFDHFELTWAYHAASQVDLTWIHRDLESGLLLRDPKLDGLSECASFTGSRLTVQWKRLCSNGRCPQSEREGAVVKKELVIWLRELVTPPSVHHNPPWARTEGSDPICPPTPWRSTAN